MMSPSKLLSFAASPLISVTKQNANSPAKGLVGNSSGPRASSHLAVGKLLRTFTK